MDTYIRMAESFHCSPKTVTTLLIGYGGGLVVSDPWDPMDCSLPGSSVHGISQARILEWVALSSSPGRSFLTQGLNLGLLHCRQILYQLSH